MQLAQIGDLIQTRRMQVGLSQQRLATLAGLSRLTINQLERGTFKDFGAAKLIALASLLRIDISAQVKPAKANGLFMAAVTSGVSHRRQFDKKALARALSSGVIPSGFRAHISALLGEAPLEILVKAVEEAAEQEGVAPKKIWGHVFRWAKDLLLVRPELRE
ncbi:MAG: family transcriptional regulator [Betaproteobacteria bacterium]|nr:family transcriptional regulator [Betaproteobacteria bacterium]